MTAAAAALRGPAGVFTRPVSTLQGVTMPGNRLRINVMVDPDALATLDALAAVRYGGNRSRALDDCMRVGAAVLNRPEAFGRGPAAALAAYCGEGSTMAENEFHGTLYRSEREMLAAVARWWILDAGGLDSADPKALAAIANADATAADIVAWLERPGVTVEAVASAVRELDAGGGPAGRK